MPNAAIDYEKQEALNMARMQPPKADNFGVSKNGYSDDYFRVPQRESGYKDANDEDNEESNGNVSHADRLEKARTEPIDNDTKNTKKPAKIITPMAAISLLGQIHFLGDIPYMAALGAAMLKDLLDLVFVGSLPGIGTVITVCCSIFITMMFILAGISDKTSKKARRLAKSKAFQKTVIRMLAVITGTVIEFVPGIDFFPVESAIVIIVYAWTLIDRKKSQQQEMELEDED